MKHITCIEDLRQLHIRKVPKAFFDYADRGSYSEDTLRANRDDLQAIKFRQRILVDVSKRDLSTTILGEPASLPLILAPVGLLGMQHGDGEIIACRAAQAAVPWLARHEVVGIGTGTTVDQFIANYNAAVAGYRQTVLTAFQQVEDNLAAVRIQSQEIQKLQQAVNSAETYLKLEMGRYETGIDPYLNVVIAQTTLLNNQQALINAQVAQMTACVQLIAALGGGWDRAQLPNPAQVTQKPTKAESAIQH